jgi:hypothetical protein
VGDGLRYGHWCEPGTVFHFSLKDTGEWSATLIEQRIYGATMLNNTASRDATTMSVAGEEVLGEFVA